MSNTGSWIKPVVVLVPGAWNSPGSFNLLTPHLEVAGYTTHCVALPSVGAAPPIDDIQPDVEAIRSTIQPIVDAGQDVLLFMHDYGSVPGGEAVKGLDKATRTRGGLNGGVTCLLYAASPILPAGSCMADMFQDSDYSWIVVSRNEKVAIPERPMEIFCPEVEPQLAKEYTESLKAHSYQTFFGRTTWEPYKEIPFFCLFCKLDKVISLEKQKETAAAVNLRFKSTTLVAGHCPFLALPEEVVKAIRRAAKESIYYGGVVARDYGSVAAAHSPSRPAPN